MNKQHPRRVRGMTLLETLIVVGIATAVIGTIIFMMQRFSERERAEVAVRMQGQEMANAAKAIREYAKTVGEDWADGDRVEVTIDDLVEAGLLPEGFGDRDGAGVLGVTPIGQAYRVFSVKDGGFYDDPNVENGTIASVVIDLGPPNPGRMERAGIANMPERILAYKEAVALYTAREERIAMGVVPAGAGEVRGVGRVFTKDVIGWLENYPTEGAAVALVGFPDLDPPGTNTTPTPPTDQYADCQVVPDHAGCGPLGCVPYDPPTCSSPWVELARPRICGLGGTVVSSTPVGVVVGGVTRETNSTGANTASLCNLSRQTISYGGVSLNGAEIFREACSSSQTTSEWVYDPIRRENVCTPTTSGQDAHLGVPGNPDAYGLLCCLPRPE